MKDIKNKHVCSILLLAALGAQFACANETFQNNLLKMDVHKSSLGGVKVTLYTSKPYNDNVIVNKKGENEYVILMPETSNSMTAKPPLGTVSDTVKNIDVKTQQYQNQVKGYTKIVISTHGTTEITPQVQTLSTSDYKVSERDYRELLSQINKRKSAPAKTSATVPQKSVQKSSRLAKQVPPRPSKLRVSPTIVAQKTIEKIISKRKIQPVKQTAENQFKPATKEQQLPVKIAEQQPSTPVETQTQPSVQNEVVTAPMVKESNQAIMPETPSAQKPIRKIQKIKAVVKNNLSTLVGLGAAIFLLLLLGARKITKDTKKQKEIFTEHLEEKPLSVTDYTEKIDEDMTWKEKYQAYMETKESQAQQDLQPQKSDIQENPELDSLFGDQIEESYEDTVDEDIFVQQDYEPTSVTPSSQEVYSGDDSFEPEDFEQLQGYSDESEVSIDDLFEDEEEDITEEHTQLSEDFLDSLETEEEYQEEIEEPAEENFVKSEFAIDSDKGFYLVDFEDETALVGHIDEEIFVLKRFDKKINAPIQARLNERTANSTSFMTKVGNFRGIVEVTPEKMNLLIEL